MRTDYVAPGQIRAARAILGWSQEDLADLAGISVATIRKLELGHISPRASTNGFIQNAIEGAGLEFTDGEGVRRCQQGLTVFEGKEGFESFLADIRRTAKGLGLLVVVGKDSVAARKSSSRYSSMLHEICTSTPAGSVKCIVNELTDVASVSPQIEFRLLSINHVDPVPSCVYGDKHAIFISRGGEMPKIIVIQSTVASERAARQFFSLWKLAAPISDEPTDSPSKN